MKAYGIDHIALTVPDLEEATDFFVNVFDAEIIVEGLRTEEEPWSGAEIETSFGLPRGGTVRARRVLQLGRGAHIELFCFGGTAHRSAAHTYDYGLQHIAVYVDSLQETAQRFMQAGGTLFAGPSYTEAVKKGLGPEKGWLYGKTPWGTVMEMVTFQEGR